MSLEEDVRSIFTGGSSSEPQNTECKEAIDRLTVLVNKEKEFGPLLGTILNEDWGIVKSICLYYNKRGKWQIAKQLLRLLSKIINHAGCLLDSYAEQILALCEELDSHGVSPALIGCEIFTELVNNVPWSVRRVIRTFFQRYLGRLKYWDISFKRIKFAPFFGLIDLLMDNFHDDLRITQAYEQLWDVLVQKLSVGCLDDNPSGKLLIKVMNYYSPDEEQRRTFYGFFRSHFDTIQISDSNSSQSAALLRFFPKFIPLFEVEVMEDYGFWHRLYLTLMTSDAGHLSASVSDSSSNVLSMSEFYIRIFSLSIEPTDGFVSYFAGHLFSGLSKKTLIACDSVCLIMWSAMAREHLGLVDEDGFLNAVTKFLLSSFFPGIDPCCYIGCLLSAFVLMRSNTLLFTKYIDVLVDTLVNFTVSYKGHGDNIVLNLQVCLLNLTANCNNVNYLKRIISLLLLKTSAKHTACDFTFWTQLFSDIPHSDFLASAICRGWQPSDMIPMKSRVFDTLLETTLILCNKLNFTASQLKGKVDGSLDLQIVMDSPGDVTLFANVVSVLGHLLENVHVDEFAVVSWDSVLLEGTMKLCVSNPYTLPLFSLLSIILKSYGGSLHKIDCRLIGNLIDNCFEHYPEFSGELQTAYIRVVLSLPCSYLINRRNALLPFLKTTFLVARTNKKLAKHAVRVLGEWVRYFGKERFYNILMDIMPILSSLMKVAPGMNGRRKIAKHNEDDDLQKEVFLLLGVLEPEFIEQFYVSFRPEIPSGNSLIIKLSSGDRPFDINLSALLPDVLLLVSQAGDPEERRRCCELLSIIPRYILGKCVGGNQESLAQTFKVVLIHICDLAHDTKPEICGLFSPLMIQCVNLFSSQITSEEMNTAFIEALFDRVMLSSRREVVLQACNFLNHLVKTSGTAQGYNVEIIMNCIHRYIFSLDSAQRRGASLALKSVVEPLMNQMWSYDKYCYLVVYLAVTCLCTSNRNVCVVEVLDTINQLISSDKSVFCQNSDVRVVPPGFKNTEIAEMISWLLDRGTKFNTSVTWECSRLIKHLSTLDCDGETNTSPLRYLSERFEVISSQLSENDLDDFRKTVENLNVDCLLCFYVWSLEHLGLMNYDECTGFFVNEQVRIVIKWVLSRIYMDPGPGKAVDGDTYLFHKQYFGDMMIATIKITVCALNSRNPVSVVFFAHNLDKIYYQFLCHPSQVMVERNSKPYLDFSAALWKFIAANESLVEMFLKIFSGEMEGLIKRLRLWMQDASCELECADLELMDWVRRMDISFVRLGCTEIIKSKVDNWIDSGWEVCGSQLASDQVFQASIPHFTNLFDFFFSFVPPKKVLQIMFKLNQASQQERVYTAFEPIFLKHIFKCGDVFDKSWFTNIDKNMNLLRLILNNPDSYSRGDGFPTAVKEALDSFVSRNMLFCKSFADKRSMFTLLCSLGHAFSSPDGCFAGTALETLICRWAYDKNSQIYLRLIPFLSPALLDDVMQLRLFREDCTTDFDEAKSILSACLLSGHYNIVTWFVEKVSSKKSVLHEVLEMMSPLFSSLNISTQGKVLCQVYSCALSLEPPVFAEHCDVLSRLIETADVSARKSFYIQNWNVIRTCIFQTNLGCDGVREPNEVLKYLAINLFLVTKMYGVFDKTDLLGDGGILTPEVDGGRTFAKNMLQKCYEFQTLQQMETDCPIHPVVWRQFQSFALNCLIVILCDTKMIGKVLIHLVFQDAKLGSGSAVVLESIVHGLPQRFISWDEAKQLKNRRKKLVDTGIKNSLTLRKASFREYYSDVSVTTVSQDCKAFDFVNRRSIHPSDERNTIFEVAEDGDLLDNHDCLPYLCSMIYKTVECGLTPTVASKTIPDWMNSFMKLLLHDRTAANTKSLIVKVVHRCQEVFKPFWFFWYMPVLRALSSGHCGDGNTYFFYQVAKMLITWNQPRMTGGELKLELKGWSRVVKLLLAGIYKPNDARHILRLLKWITKFRSDLQPPCQILTRLLAVGSLFEIGLEAFIIAFESDAVSHGDDNFLEEVFRILHNKKEDETMDKQARVVGLLLKMTANATKRKQYFDQVIASLKKRRDSDKGKFFRELLEMSHNFPQISEEFIPTILLFLENEKHRVLHTSCLAVLDNIVKHSTTPEFFGKLKKSKILSVQSGDLHASALHRLLNILACFVSLGIRDINVYILTFLKRNIDGTDSKPVSREVKLQMYRVTAAAFKSLGEEGIQLPGYQQWLFERSFVEKSPALVEEVASHVAEYLTRVGSCQEAALMLLEAMARTPFSYHASRCLLYTFLQRSFLRYKPENLIVDSTYAVKETEAAGLLEVNSSLSKQGKDFGTSLAIVEDQDLVAAPEASVRSVVLLTEPLELDKPGKLPKTLLAYHEVLLRLKAVCQKSKKIVCSIFTSVFGSIFSVPLNPNQTRRFEKVCTAILEGLLVTQMDDTLPSLLLKLCSENSVSLPPALLYNACHMYELEEVGILMTETRLWNSPPVISWDSAPSDLLDYYTSLTMSYGSIGMMDVAGRIKEILPERMPGGGVPDVSLRDIFSQQQQLKAFAALSNWDQLEEIVTASSSLNPDRSISQHNLGFHILSETNRKILASSSSYCDKISSWLNVEKSNNWSFKPRFQMGKSMLYFLNDEVDEFTTTSKHTITFWTYWNALQGKFHQFRHGVTAKKILDHHTMAVTISETGGTPSSSQLTPFHVQLSMDAPCFPYDPIQWKQIITDREHFLLHLAKQSGLEVSIRDSTHIQYLRIEFIKFLISQGKISEAESYALLYSKEPERGVSLESSVLLLGKSKFDPLLHSHPQLRIDRLWECWDIIAPKLNTGTSALEVTQFTEHVIDVCSEFLLLLKSGVLVDTGRVRAAVALNMKCSDAVHLTDVEALICGVDYMYDKLSHNIETSPTSHLRSSQMLADAYFKYTKFNLTFLKDSSNNCFKTRLRFNIVKSALSYMAICRSPDMVLFLTVLETVAEQSSDEMASYFQKYVSKIELPRLEILLPQIMARYAVNHETVPILEPVVNYFLEKWPEFVILHTLPYVEYDRVENDIVDKLLRRAGVPRLGLFMKFVEALNTLCNPQTLLKDYLIRIAKAESAEKVIALKNEAMSKCRYLNSMILGPIYNLNSMYWGHWFEDLCQKKTNNASVKELLSLINQKFPSALRLPGREFDLSDFSPFLKRFNIMDINFPVPDQFGTRQSKSFVKIYPKVTGHATLREPLEIRVLASDGHQYPFLFKFGDDLRQDQLIQHAFFVMNGAIKRQTDWDAESIITYNVLPLSSRFGMIEKLEPTIPLTHLLRIREEPPWRSATLARHRAWLEEVQREEPIVIDGTCRKDTPLAVHVALACDGNTLAQAFDDKAKDVPADIFRRCLHHQSDSMRDFFYKRRNFLQSHAVLSFCHWVLGIGDRHLGNFLLDENTCRLVGIDFGHAFGERMEYLKSPELIPFRLTPQFQSIYGSLYITGMLKSTMSKCFSSIAGDDLEVILQVTKLIPVNVARNAKANRDEYLAHLQNKSIRVLQMLKRKLTLENPVAIIEDHVRAGRYEDEFMEVFCRMLRKIQVPEEFSSADDVISALINIASDKALLIVLPPVFEPWV